MSIDWDAIYRARERVHRANLEIEARRRLVAEYLDRATQEAERRERERFKQELYAKATMRAEARRRAEGTEANSTAARQEFDIELTSSEIDPELQQIENKR